MGENFFEPCPSEGDLWFPEKASDTQALFYKSIADFTREIMGPAEQKLIGGNHTMARSLFTQCAELGVFAAELSEEDGGLGFGVIDATLLSEALGRGHSLSVGFMVHQGVGMLPVACFGNGAQRAHYLPRAASGECIMAFALTEPHCGSDALALTTAAIPNGDGYVIDGAKQFITNGAYADCFITFARVPEVGITAFLVDRDAHGLTIGTEEQKLGQHASSTCSVFYEKVAVDTSKVLGVVGQGHKIALNMLNLGRLKLAAGCVGKMKALLPVAMAYTEERSAFGQPIVGFGMVRERLARMATSLYAVESTVYRVASVMERALSEANVKGAGLSGTERLTILQDFAFECALVKSLATEALGVFTDDMLQLYGGYGFSEEYPAAKAWRDARVTRLYEGTTEICRLTMMQRLLAVCHKSGGGVAEENGHVYGQKEILRRLLEAELDEQSDAHRHILARQAHCGALMAVSERIYAAESVQLRASDGDYYPRLLADHYVGMATSDNLADFHRVTGCFPEVAQGIFADSSVFPTIDLVHLRDCIVAGLRDFQGVLGEGALQ